MMTIIKLLLLTLAGLLPLQLFAQHEISTHTPVSLEAVNVPHEQSLFHVQTEWINQDNEALVLGDFAGQPLVVVMFYGQCTGTCPVLIQRTWNLYKQLDQQVKEQMQVLAVSFDYRNDSPKALKEYAEREQLDIPNWSFVTADHSSIRELAMLLGVQYRERNDGHFEHSNLITVLDDEGKIAVRISGLQASLDEAVTNIEHIAKEKFQ
ncbi:MAG: SCO family protein [Balneolales bacterium]